MKARSTNGLRRHSRLAWGATLFALLCVLAPCPAQAHRVTVFAWVEGGTVYTESKFSGGRRVSGGDMLVYDLEGNQLLSGKTDEHGEFSFAMPGKTGMRIVLQAGSGHRGEWTIPAGEIAPDAQKAQPSAAPAVPPGNPEGRTEMQGASLDQVRLAVEHALDQRLAPLLKMMAEKEDSGPTLRDILGGMGYIFGLMGVAAYIHFRRREGDVAGKRKG